MGEEGDLVTVVLDYEELPFIKRVTALPSSGNVCWPRDLVLSAKHGVSCTFRA